MLLTPSPCRPDVLAACQPARLPVHLIFTYRMGHQHLVDSCRQLAQPLPGVCGPRTHHSALLRPQSTPQGAAVLHSSWRLTRIVASSSWGELAMKAISLNRLKTGFCP